MATVGFKGLMSADTASAGSGNQMPQQHQTARFNQNKNKNNCCGVYQHQRNSETLWSAIVI